MASKTFVTRVALAMLTVSVGQADALKLKPMVNGVRVTAYDAIQRDIKENMNGNWPLQYSNIRESTSPLPFPYVEISDGRYHNGRVFYGIPKSTYRAYGLNNAATRKRDSEFLAANADDKENDRNVMSRIMRGIAKDEEKARQNQEAAKKKEDQRREGLQEAYKDFRKRSEAQSRSAAEHKSHKGDLTSARKESSDTESVWSVRTTSSTTPKQREQRNKTIRTITKLSDRVKDKDTYGRAFHGLTTPAEEKLTLKEIESVASYLTGQKLADAVGMKKFKGQVLPESIKQFLQKKHNKNKIQRGHYRLKRNFRFSLKN